MDTNLGRTEVAYLQNKSGGSVAQGDVVVIDTANAKAFTTTTTSGYQSTRVGVVLDVNGIASNSYGFVAFGGWVPKINLSASCNIGDMIKTHSVAKQGVAFASPVVAGTFAEALEASATPSALLFGMEAFVTTAAGFMPVAFPLNYSSSMAFTTSLSLPANGGSVAIPFRLDAPMQLHSVSVRNLDTATQRTFGWDLYQQVLVTDNVLTRVAASNANTVSTPSAASTQTSDAASQPVTLQPGLYWLVVQNRDATSTFSLGTTAVGSAFAPNMGQTKTTTSPNGSTLDFTAATWTKITAIAGVSLNGNVFGQSSIF